MTRSKDLKIQGQYPTILSAISSVERINTSAHSVTSVLSGFYWCFQLLVGKCLSISAAPGITLKIRRSIKTISTFIFQLGSLLSPSGVSRLLYGNNISERDLSVLMSGQELET